MICCVNLKLQQYCRGAVLHIMLPKVDLILVSSLFCVKKWRKRTFVVRDNRFYLTMCNLLSARCDHKICVIISLFTIYIPTDNR